MSTLNVKIFRDHFEFQSPSGDPFLLEKTVPKPRQDAAGRLFTTKHPLSDELKSKIESQINFQESKFGFWKQFLFGLLLPSGLLLGNCFDLDRDMPLLRDEISQILSTVFAPQEYKMVEYVTEGKYKDGKILYKIHF